jgi:eukaryotic-like serine/threonine-protein kinase
LTARHHTGNAVATYDAEEDGDELYLVMELVEGPSVATRLLGGRQQVGEALAIADGVLVALGAANTAGIVHRDVKPGNVLATCSSSTCSVSPIGTVGLGRWSR